MALGLILIGILLILPGNLFESLNSHQTADEFNEYAELIRKLRFLARHESIDNQDNILKQRFEKKFHEPRKHASDWQEVVGEDKRLQSIEKDAIEPDDTEKTSKSTTAKTTQQNETPAAPLPQVQNKHTDNSSLTAGTDLYFILIVAVCSLAGFVGLIMAGVCWYRLNKNIKAASEVDYPAYGVTGPTKERLGSGPGDRKLAQSAQMYHYQHQKQQMIAMEKANGEMKHDASEDESEEENEEGDYTVYECPGLAPTGEMEVRNPLFNEETPVSKGPTEDQKDTQ
ncbi:neural proliferation differentiation and control protein 1-like [Mytilus edulis]|uniref:neural proliferation differentiation and control protein 1-like n=1 Tax=Mytilus edulis TaxID=6550 RepID=UPI0039F11BB0